MYKWFFWIFLIDCLVLGYVGAKPAEGVFIIIGRVATAWYFLHFLVVIPLLAKFETPKELPKSISEPVLGGAGAEPAVAASKAMEKA